jgi:benzodiazapine receptor
MSGLASLLIFLLASFAAGGIGVYFTNPALPTWYAGLQKPRWTPPNALFGPVWTALYVMIALAGWFVWRNRGHADVRAPMAIFIAQLFLNAAWAVIFFGARRIGLAFIDIILLWIAIFACVAEFSRVSVASALLMTPYLGWVAYAAALNYAIWRLNP